jgi:hypothetical protein
MYQITAGEHEFFTAPVLNFRGTPLGIDVRKVMATGILPFINTGIAHKEPGVGWWAQVWSVPQEVFRGCLQGFEGTRISMIRLLRQGVI